MEQITQLDLKGYAQTYNDYAIEIRRKIHAYPELAWEEEQTIALLIEEIEKFHPHSHVDLNIVHLEGGFYVDVNYADHLKRLIFRADIDALPIKEATHLPYSSQVEGKMHACGHDCHAAMLLAALKVICENPLPLSNNLRFVFQRAEEVGPERSGGRSLCNEGICDDISEVFALHVSTLLEGGTFSSRSGAMMANTTTFSFTIDCSGGHVMRPHHGDNAIDIQTDINIALRGLERKLLDPTEPCCFVPSISNAGVGSNIRPNHLEMTYAFRSFTSPQERERFAHAVKQKVKAVLSSYETAKLTQFFTSEGYPVLVNDPIATDQVYQIMQAAHFKTDETPTLFCGEDFAYYLNERKGGYWILGVSQNGGQDHHTPHFNPDDSYLWMGIAFWLHLAVHYGS